MLTFLLFKIARENEAFFTSLQRVFASVTDRERTFHPCLHFTYI